MPDDTAVLERSNSRSLTTLPMAEALEAFTPEFEVALPDHIPVDRFKRVVLTAINNSTPQNNLAAADRRSLFNACVRCAQDGLYPDGKEAALVVYNTKTRGPDGQDYWAPLVQYLPMIQGIRKRMRNTGEVLSADAEIVYENDQFDYELGDNPRIEHKPPPFGTERGRPLGAYSIIKLRNGEILRETMSAQQIGVVREQSRAKDGLMWTKFWDEAWRKTVLRRCGKAAPTGSDLHRLLNRDDEPLQLPPLSEMRKVPPRPQLGDFTMPTIEAESEPKPEPSTAPRVPRRGRPRAEPVAAEPVAETAPPAAAERPYFFSDEYGEVVESADVNEAVALYAERLEAARGNPPLLAATWENGARLLAALRERGHATAADMLNAEYGRLQGEIEAVSSPAATSAEPDDGKPEYDVLVPLLDGMPVNQWHMTARIKLMELKKLNRPPSDFARFREINATARARLKTEYSMYSKTLEEAIDKGISGA